MSPHETKVQYVKIVLGVIALIAFIYVIYLMRQEVALLRLIIALPTQLSTY